MEAQIKEEVKEASLRFETSGDDLLHSLSLVEKYDRFLENDNNSDVDSDGDFFPNDSMLKEQYAQLRNGTANYTNANAQNHRLSTGLPGKYRNLDTTNLSIVVDDDSTNGMSDEGRSSTESSDVNEKKPGLSELIEKLELVRKCAGDSQEEDEDGNSIFCTEKELTDIQERYGQLLDFIHEMSSNFEPRSSPKADLADEQEEDEQQLLEGGEHNGSEQSEDMKLLNAKMESLQRTRDKFCEVEQQVREQLDQLELVERYKMESVG